MYEKKRLAIIAASVVLLLVLLAYYITGNPRYSLFKILNDIGSYNEYIAYDCIVSSNDEEVNANLDMLSMVTGLTLKNCVVYIASSSMLEDIAQNNLKLKFVLSSRGIPVGGFIAKLHCDKKNKTEASCNLYSYYENMQLNFIMYNNRWVLNSINP